MDKEQLIQQSRQEGIEQTKREIARHLLQLEVNKDIIMSATGFTLRELALLSY